MWPGVPDVPGVAADVGLRGDDGSTDPHLGAALARTGAQERLRAVVDALVRARLLVPVVAHLDEHAEEVAGAGGMPIAGEKQASAAMVTVATPDGRSAMPVFSALQTLHAWRPDARPIPVPGPQAALATVTESDGLLVLDPAGPVPVLVPRPAVWALAQGRPWVPPADDDQLRAQVGAALRKVPGGRDGGTGRRTGRGHHGGPGGTSRAVPRAGGPDHVPGRCGTGTM
ncbi:SseB family protein [Sanguibacter sp. Z1732]|uniref:SseB family protein n=1 Tax=Sanguibacter sp. Z1732 TaxID=3435412 RepID=UPI003D9C9018